MLFRVGIGVRNGGALCCGCSVAEGCVKIEKNKKKNNTTKKKRVKITPSNNAYIVNFFCTACGCCSDFAELFVACRGRGVADDSKGVARL